MTFLQNWIKRFRHWLICQGLHKWSYEGKASSFAESVWRIYNETPIRQDRAFHHYGRSMDSVAKQLGLLNGLPFSKKRTCYVCKAKERFVGVDKKGRMIWVKNT
jgi:hypothetical protein